MLSRDRKWVLYIGAEYVQQCIEVVAIIIAKIQLLSQQYVDVFGIFDLVVVDEYAFYRFLFLSFHLTGYINSIAKS